MPRTIRCTNCGITLNLPEHAAGRRLKCPKCGTKFQATAVDLNAASTAPGVSDARFDSLSGLVPIPKGLQDLQDLPLPTAAGDLRETFDLPSMTGAATGGAARPEREVADALALFEKGAALKRLQAAEARAKIRRCPTCGGVVPAGTSICLGCGFDLETGARVELDDDLLPEAPPAAESMPIDIAIVGGTCLLASLVLAVLALVQWKRGLDGAQFLALICLFGTYAAITFLRLKSAKPLLVALTLGALVNVVALIVLPAWHAFEPEERVVFQSPPMDDPDFDGTVIQPVTERLDTQKITWGVAVLCTYAAVSVYLLSPGVRRRLGRSAGPAGLPPP
jgi:phage FluMu protein Com